MMPSAPQKLRVFVPQFIMYALTVLSVVAGHNWQGNTVVFGVALFVGIPMGICTFVTTLHKTFEILDGDGWGRFITDRGCRRCRLLVQKNIELTEALATLQLPEDRP